MSCYQHAQNYHMFVVFNNSVTSTFTKSVSLIFVYFKLNDFQTTLY